MASAVALGRERSETGEEPTSDTLPLDGRFDSEEHHRQCDMAVLRPGALAALDQREARAADDHAVIRADDHGHVQPSKLFRACVEQPVAS